MRLEETKVFIDLHLQLGNAGLTPNERTLVRCQLAKELEAAGDHDGATAALGVLWPGVGNRPPVEGIDNPVVAAELLLRVGCLTSRFCKEEGIEGAQEAAISFVKESINIYQALGAQDKVGEALTELGSFYWRQGSYEEARSTLCWAMEVLDEVKNEVAAVALVRAALVENSAGRHHVCYQLLKDEGGWIANIENHQIRGLYHIILADVLLFLSSKEQGATSAQDESTSPSLFDRALIEYAAAGFHFEEAGHNRHAARVLNNTAYLLFTHGKYEEAHEYLERARAIFQILSADSSLAQVDETRARVLLAQHRVSEAVEVAGGAVEALRRGDDVGELAQALTTYGRALARVDQYADAKGSLEEAIARATACGDRENAGQACLAIIEELADVLPAYEVWARYEAADEYLADTQRPETLSRLRACARITLTIGRRALRTDLEDGWTGCDLLAEVKRYEHDLIAQAMAAEGCSISHAARRLQIKHQTLRQIINGRYKDTLGKEYPARRRGPKDTKQSAVE